MDGPIGLYLGMLLSSGGKRESLKKSEPRTIKIRDYVFVLYLGIFVICTK